MRPGWSFATLVPQMMGCSRDKEGEPQVLDRATGKPVSHKTANVSVGLQGEVKVKGGGVAVPAFMLMTEAYMDDRYGPEEVAGIVGISATRIRQFAADLAEAAFAREVVVDQPWIDWKGERHEKMIGCPVSMHAMRGISAHSNGFQTCRALHVLQLMLGSVEVPGGFRFKPPYPKPPHAHPGAGWSAGPGGCWKAASAVRRWAMFSGRKICLLDRRESHSVSTRPIAGMRRCRHMD